MAEQHVIDQYTYRLPHLDVRSIACGGGSIAWVDEATGGLRVGAASAGSEPGPACYGRGGVEPPVARLRAMVPAAGQRLDYLPPAQAAALLMRLDPAFAVGALAGMGWWGPKRTLSRMPLDVAATLLTRLRSDSAARGRKDLDFELHR